MKAFKIRRLLGLGACLLLLGGLGGCDYYERKGTHTPVQEPDAPTEPRPLEPTFASLHSQVIGPMCVDCHEGPSAKGNLDLSTYDGVLSAVVPGDPDESLLYLMVDWDEMPPGGGVSVEEKATLKTWILNGAKPGDSQ